MWSKGITNTQFLQQLMQAHVKSANNMNWLKLLFSGEHWRYKSIDKTLQVLTDPIKCSNLERHAQNNLIQWRRNAQEWPARVEVSTQDWGAVCAEVTEKHGVPYTVLNHASARFPGGGFLRFGSAQEENMWHRSTCALSLGEKHIHFDAKTLSFSYDTHMSQLITAGLPMDPSEQNRLKQLNGYENPDAHRVYLSALPRVCFRGPEILIDRNNVEERNGKNTIVADPDLSFQFLPEKLIFPFYEMRSAAPNLHSDDLYWNDSKKFEHYKQVIRHCIAAQLDTLILQEKKHIILGAWGCGEFHNDPYIIAQTYREEISKRAQYFQHIIFAILRNASHHHTNHRAFEEQLADLPLGSKASTIDFSMDNKTGCRSGIK